MELAEIFGQAINMAFGDIGLAVIVLFAGIAVIMWKSNVPLGAILIIGLPFVGALMQATTQNFVITLFAIGFIVIAFMIWLALGELTKKY